MTSIVGAIIVIIPRPDDRTILLQSLIPRLIGQHSILLAHQLHVFGICINIITQEDKQLGLGRDDVFPDWLRLILTGA